jgi:hypothetical protein
MFRSLELAIGEPSQGFENVARDLQSRIRISWAKKFEGGPKTSASGAKRIVTALAN